MRCWSVSLSQGIQGNEDFMEKLEKEHVVKRLRTPRQFRECIAIPRGPLTGGRRKKIIGSVENVDSTSNED